MSSEAQLAKCSSEITDERPAASNGRGEINAVELAMEVIKERQDGLFVKFSGVAAAIQPKYPHPGARNLPIMVESRFGGRKEPDEQLACFDLMFYVSSGAGENWFEFEDRWSPVWNMVGTRFGFNEGLRELARAYVGRALGVEEGVEEIPPVSAVLSLSEECEYNLFRW